MRIALCISGQPRGLEKNVNHIIEHLIKPSEISDVFIHTWFDESLIGKPFSSGQPAQNEKLGCWTEDTLDQLNKLNPIKFLYEPNKSFEEFNDLEGLPSAMQTQLASNIYSVYSANKLKSDYEKENNFKYDLVIKTRIDCKYDKAYDIRNYLDINWTSVLHIPYIHQHMRADDSYPSSDGTFYSSLSDTFAYGSSQIVDIFSNIFTNFRNIHNKIRPFPYGECYFGYQVRGLHKIQISMQNINYILSR